MQNFSEINETRIQSPDEPKQQPQTDLRKEAEAIAQLAIDHRHGTPSQNGLSDFELFHLIADAITDFAQPSREAIREGIEALEFTQNILKRSGENRSQTLAKIESSVLKLKALL